MVKYCTIANQYGQQPVTVFEKRGKITILLEATDEKNWALRDYEKYCSPIFHLSAVDTDVVRLDKDTELKTAVVQFLTNSKNVAGEKEKVNKLMIELEDEKLDGRLLLNSLPLEENGSFLTKMINKNNIETNRVETLVKSVLEIVEGIQGSRHSLSS